MQLISILLLMAAAFAGLAGLASLSNATYGVGGITLACLLAIVARIAQSVYQHAEIRRLLSGEKLGRKAGDAMMVKCAACGYEAFAGRSACPKCQVPYVMPTQA